MRLFRSLVVICLSISFLVACGGPSATPEAVVADTVYTNSKVYTVNEAQPWAEAVAIKDGKFIAVGLADDMTAVTGDDTEVVDLAAR